MAKKKVRKGIKTSHQRSTEAVRQASLKAIADREAFVRKTLGDLEDQKRQIAEEQEAYEMREGVVVELSIPYSTYLENLDLKRKEVYEEAKLLPDSVIPIFNQTRDGNFTPEEQKKEIVNNPEILGDNVYDAIRLGIQAWGSSLFPERG